MKKLNILLILLFPISLFCQDPGLVNLSFNPNPPTEGGSGSAIFTIGSFAGDIPANSGLTVRVSSGNLDFSASMPTGTIGGFTWVYDNLFSEWIGTQVDEILDGEAGMITCPYVVTGLEGNTAIININLAGVPSEAEGNVVLNDQIDISSIIDEVLPVKFTSFRIDNVGCSQSQLSWTTASETNNEGFVVERSFGNLDNFTEVGFLKGAGNSAVDVSYEFVDKFPIDETEAYVYYRLQQIDFNGVSDLSDVVKGKRDCEFHIDGFTVTPNPATNETYIKSDVNSEEANVATVINSRGQIVEKVLITSPTQQLDLNSYLPGVYSIRMDMDGEVVTKRFIKIQ